MPFLLLVLDEIERRDLPGEFALLPYVESTYQPLPSRGNRPAGMWQLMPTTARSQGLIVASDFDGRLDALAATRASLDLIAVYEEKFGDWRLANMAFNAGEFRVSKLLGSLIGKRSASELSATELARLTFSSITHEHLDKLLALACIIDDPARFKVILPEPAIGDRLEVFNLPAPLDLRIAARFAGVSNADFARLNAAYRQPRMRPGMPLRLLIPADHRAQFSEATARVDSGLWAEWHEAKTSKVTSLPTLARAASIPLAALAAINGLAENSALAKGTPVLLPGAEVEAANTDSDAPTHIVGKGDTLGGIARQYGVKLPQLLRWNGITLHSLIHPGQRLRIGPGDDR
ncbi:MAG: LysM peptidoglycan-binding domain-containing protein [Dokdonella sp.]